MKVSLSVGWLSENALLQIALTQLGYSVEVTDKGQLIGATASGVMSYVQGEPALFLEWDDYLEFTLSQLADIGFELGDEHVLENAICAKVLVESSFANMPQPVEDNDA